MAWLPGQEGAEAITDALCGDACPGGKLPITYPRSSGQIPVFYGHKVSGGRSHWKGDYVDSPAAPLYPFGHGLSYTTFVLSDASIVRDELSWNDSITTTVTVTNTGDRDGDEVIQLYVRDPIATVTRPVLELKGFVRVRLAAGESRTVTFETPLGQVGFYDRDARLRRRGRSHRCVRRHLVGRPRPRRIGHRRARLDRPAGQGVRRNRHRHLKPDNWGHRHGRVLHRGCRADPVRGPRQRQPAGVPLVRRRPRRRRAADGGPPPVRRLLLALVQLGRLRHLRRRHARSPVASDVRPGGRSDRGGDAEDGGGVRVLRQARRAVLLLPRPGHRAARGARSRSRRRCSTRWSRSPPATRNAPVSSCCGARRTCSPTRATRRVPPPTRTRRCTPTPPPRWPTAWRPRIASAGTTTCCGVVVRATTRCSTPTCAASSTSSGGSCRWSSSTSSASGSRARS